MSYLVSAVLLGTIRREEAPPPPREDREPVLAEIRDGLRLVRHDPILRAFAGAQMALAGAVGHLRGDLVPVRPRRPPARARPCSGSSPASVASRRSSARWSRPGRRGASGIGPVAIVAMLLVGGRQRVHPAGAGRAAARRDRLPRHAAAGRRLGGDRLRHHRGVGPPDAGPRPGARAGRRRPSRSRRCSPSWSATLGGRAAGRGRSGCARRRGWRRSAGCSGRRSCGSRRCGTCCVLPAVGRGRAAGRPRSRSPSPPRWTSRPGRDRAAVRRRAPRRTRRGRTGSGRRRPPPPRRSGPGSSSASSMAKTMPPLAVESSLVRTIPVRPDRLVEGLGLGEAVLAGRRVEHEDRLGLGAGQALVDDPADLGQLVHQVRAGVEPAGGVGDDEVGAAGHGRVERVVDDRAGVGARARGRPSGPWPGRPRSGAGRWPRRGTCRRRRGCTDRPSAA